MPLPVGFKVNGSKIHQSNNISLPPRVRKIIALLDKLPTGELLTTLEVMERLNLYPNGGAARSSALLGYREKVNNKLFWGNQNTIAELRRQLAEREENS